jgi:adenylate cyclase
MKNMEIERKFLVHKDNWLRLSKPAGILYIQGYLGIDDDKIIRVRVAGEQGFLTIKGRSETISHPEYEYSIPADDARELMRQYTKNQVEKVRTRIPAGNHVWEVDEFHGDNEGLLMAEIELESPDDVFEKPAWLGEEVTGDKRYYNACLSIHPYGRWKK